MIQNKSNKNKKSKEAGGRWLQRGANKDYGAWPITEKLTSHCFLLGGAWWIHGANRKILGQEKQSPLHTNWKEGRKDTFKWIPNFNKKNIRSRQSQVSHILTRAITVSAVPEVTRGHLWRRANHWKSRTIIFVSMCFIRIHK